MFYVHVYKFPLLCIKKVEDVEKKNEISFEIPNKKKSWIYISRIPLLLEMDDKKLQLFYFAMPIRFWSMAFVSIYLVCVCRWMSHFLDQN